MPPQAASVLPFGEQSVDLPRQGRAAVEHLLRAPPQSTSSEHLLRAPPQSTSSLVAMVGTACTPVPKAPSHTERGAEIRSGSHAVSAASSPRPATLATPCKPPHPPGPAPRRTRRGAPPRGAPGRVPVLRRSSGGPRRAWSGPGRGNVDLGPVVLGELGRAHRRGRAIGRASDRGCTSGATRAAPPEQRRQGNAAEATPPGPA